MTQRILIADDEPLYLRTTGDLLRKAGYECTCVPDAHEALNRLRNEHFDLVLSDLSMPGNFKLELLHAIGNQAWKTPIIVITGVPSLPSAIESIRLGITDYLLKPVKFDDLLAAVRRALANSANLRASATTPREHSEWTQLFPELLGTSPAMLEIFEIVDRVAATDTNILITGESGTGKEVVARTIHHHSHRKAGKFQVIDCTAVPETLFESMLFGHKKGAFTGAVSDEPGLLRHCDGGTAFFDEIGELPLPLQAKLLRAVQEQTFTPVGSHNPVTVNTRFICATNRDLQLEVNSGRFRQDLFYRLGVIHLELPALRDRGSDVTMLAAYFLNCLRPPSSQIIGVTAKAHEALQNYRWPGNIRELRNVIERAIALTQGTRIDVCDLPPTLQDSNAPAANSREEASCASKEHADSVPAPKLDASREVALKAAEYQYLVGLLDLHKGNVSEAAKQAGISRQGLHKLLKLHDIQAADFRF